MAYQIVVSSFVRARIRALLLVKHYHSEVVVRPVSRGWMVSCPAVPDEQVPSKVAGSLPRDEEHGWLTYNVHNDTDVSNVDFESDRDDWYRSYSDGWFYDDD